MSICNREDLTIMTLVMLWHNDEINLYVLEPSQSIKCSGPCFQINDKKYIKLPIKGETYVAVAGFYHFY